MSFALFGTVWWRFEEDAIDAMTLNRTIVTMADEKTRALVGATSREDDAPGDLLDDDYDSETDYSSDDASNSHDSGSGEVSAVEAVELSSDGDDADDEDSDRYSEDSEGGQEEWADGDDVSNAVLSPELLDERRALADAKEPTDRVVSVTAPPDTLGSAGSSGDTQRGPRPGSVNGNIHAEPSHGRSNSGSHGVATQGPTVGGLPAANAAPVKTCAIMLPTPHGRPEPCKNSVGTSKVRHTGHLQGVWELEPRSLGLPPEEICICQAHYMADLNTTRSMAEKQATTTGVGAQQAPEPAASRESGSPLRETVRIKCRVCDWLHVISVPAAGATGEAWAWICHTQPSIDTSPYLRVPTATNCELVVHVSPPPLDGSSFLRDRAGYICSGCLLRSGVHLRQVGQQKGKQSPRCQHQSDEGAHEDRAVRAGDALLHLARRAFLGNAGPSTSPPTDAVVASPHGAPSTGATATAMTLGNTVGPNERTGIVGGDAAQSGKMNFHQVGQLLADVITKFCASEDMRIVEGANDPVELIEAMPSELRQLLDGLCKAETRREAKADAARRRRGSAVDMIMMAEKRHLRLASKKSLLGCLLMTLVRPGVRPSLLKALTYLHRSRKFNYDLGYLLRQLGLHVHQPSYVRKLEAQRHARPASVKRIDSESPIFAAMDNIDVKWKGTKSGDAFSTAVPSFHGTAAVVFVPVPPGPETAATMGFAKQGLRPKAREGAPVPPDERAPPAAPEGAPAAAPMPPVGGAAQGQGDRPTAPATPTECAPAAAPKPPTYGAAHDQGAQPAAPAAPAEGAPAAAPTPPADGTAHGQRVLPAAPAAPAVGAPAAAPTPPAYGAARDQGPKPRAGGATHGQGAQPAAPAAPAEGAPAAAPKPPAYGAAHDQGPKPRAGGATHAGQEAQPAAPAAPAEGAPAAAPKPPAEGTAHGQGVQPLAPKPPARGAGQGQGARPPAPAAPIEDDFPMQVATAEPERTSGGTIPMQVDSDSSAPPASNLGALPERRAPRACERLPPTGEECIEWFQPGHALQEFEAAVSKLVDSAHQDPTKVSVEDLKRAVKDLCDRGEDELVVEVVILPTSEHAATTNRGIADAIRSISAATPTEQRRIIVGADQAVYAKTEAYLQTTQTNAPTVAVDLYPGTFNVQMYVVRIPVQRTDSN